MNKKLMTATLGAFALISAAVPALAQDSRPMNLSIKAGVFLPSSEAARNESETWFTIGAEYRFYDFPMTNSDWHSALSFSLDHISTGNFRVMPFMVNYLGMQREWYYSAGAGIAQADFDGNEESLFTWSVGLGYNFQGGTTPAFLEAKWFNTNEADANGLAVTVGVRF